MTVVLDVEESRLPDLRPSATADPRSSNNAWTSAARSVNLSFFIPAFSLFALASQLMPQMFPSLTTATTSSRALHSQDPAGTSSHVSVPARAPGVRRSGVVYRRGSSAGGGGPRIKRNRVQVPGAPSE